MTDKAAAKIVESLDGIMFVLAFGVAALFSIAINSC